MNQKKYIDDSGVEWTRIFVTAQLSTEASIDPWDNNAFIDKTSKQKGNVGDLLDQSAELSAKRAEQNNGVDPIKEKHFKKYSEKRGGKKHPKDRSKVYESKNVKIEFDD